MATFSDSAGPAMAMVVAGNDQGLLQRNDGHGGEL